MTEAHIKIKLVRGARPSSILAKDFDPGNDNAVLYSNSTDFSWILRTAVNDLEAQGFSTFKSGSCFADLADKYNCCDTIVLLLLSTDVR